MIQDISAAYQARYPGLKRVAENLTALIADLLAAAPRIDRVSSRAKSPDRFAAKVGKVDEAGDARYEAPLSQIQDQIGARVTVFYTSDVEMVGDFLEEYFQPLEREELLPESHWEFGYFGRHCICALPEDVIPADVDQRDVPRFFELQVQTLFQHAWSEASHDVAYKATSALTADQERRFAYTAAQAWGADRVFDELWKELGGLGPENSQAGPPQGLRLGTN